MDSSRAATARLTVERGTPSFAAAPEKLPSEWTRANMRTWFRSIGADTHHSFHLARVVARPAYSYLSRMSDTIATADVSARIAHDLLHFFTSDIEAALALFAEDAVVEFPYAPSIQRPARLDGKAAIAPYFREVTALLVDLGFHDIELVPAADPEVVVMRAHGAATIVPTGKHYEQDYVFFIRIRGEKVVSYREYWNPLPVIEAFADDDIAQGSR